MRTYLCLLLLLLAGRITKAQVDFNNYKTIVSQGTLPPELTTKSSEKYKESKKDINDKKRSTRKAKDEFLLKSSFQIDEVLKSGLVLYNDPMGDYVNKVLDKIIKDADIDNDKLKVFIIKSNTVNAFATDQDIIFVTTALLARLDNEAQLAFILCHEMVHAIKNHSIDVFVASKKVEKRYNYYSSNSIEKNYLKKANYSKEKEKEADLDGFFYFWDTDYDPSEINEVFDMLQYSYMPFGDSTFSKNFFATQNMIWPPSYYLDRTQLLDEGDEDEDDDDDEESTHPSIGKRKKAIENQIDKKPAKTGQKFLVSEKEFYEARKMARFESCRISLLNKAYGNAIYSAYNLLAENPDSKYLQKTIGKGLYGLSTYYTAEQKNKVLPDWKKVEGPAQQLYHFMSRTTPKEMTVLALNYNWRLKKKFPEDIEIKAICNELVNTLAKEYYTDKKHLPETPLPDKYRTDYDSLSNDSLEITASTKEKKKEKKKKAKKEKNKYIDYALYDLAGDDDFMAVYKEKLKYWEAKNHTAKKSDEDDEDEDKNGGKTKTIVLGEGDSYDEYSDPEEASNSDQDDGEETVKHKISHKEAKNYKGEKVIFINPQYVKIDQRKDVAVRYEASENLREQFNEKLNKTADAANLKADIISGNVLNTHDADKLNQIAFLTTWIEEVVGQKGLKMLPTDYEQIQDIREQFGTKYLSVTGTVNLIEPRDDIGYLIFLTLFVYPAPFTIPKLLKPEYSSLFYITLFNLETGELEMAESSYFNVKATNDIDNSTLYDFLIKIKSAQINTDVYGTPKKSASNEDED